VAERSGTANRLIAGSQVVVCDGAMGTMLHAAGAQLTQSLCELNVSSPGLVRDLHRAYVAAGAQIVQTNTFDGNRLRLGRAGLADRVTEINIAGARLAREAAESAGEGVLVAGSVGPVMGATLVPRVSQSERASALREQIAALADWVDLILLETFGDIEALALAVDMARSECDLPVIAQLTFGDDGRTLRGEDPDEAAAEIGALDVAALGANCTVGPAILQDVVAALAASCSLPISVQPNAGLPRRQGKHLQYAHNVEYFARAAQQFVANGATIVGGCCGTTPAHIRAVAKSVLGLTTVERPREAGRRRQARSAVDASRSIPAAAETWPGAGFGVAVAMRAPRDVDVAEFVVRAGEVLASGVGELAIFDPDPPAARVSSIAAAMLLQERLGARVILQVDAADRSLAALQADLLGAHALGLHIVVCRTGAPRVSGDYPESESLWGVDSVGLISALSGLNEGVDWRGVSMSSRTRFSIGASVSPAAPDRDRELARAEEKIQAGAHFLLTDAIHDAGPSLDFIAAMRARGMSTPVIATLAPFEAPATIVALTNEIPDGVPVAQPAGFDPVDRAVDIAAALAGEATGVLLHAPLRSDPRLNELLDRLTTLRCRP
jgi:methionine synthase I (cobalamin-dependent)/5,10-methylenetetrahydrofolate reductase